MKTACVRLHSAPSRNVMRKLTSPDVLKAIHVGVTMSKAFVAFRLIHGMPESEEAVNET